MLDNESGVFDESDIKMSASVPRLTAVPFAKEPENSAFIIQIRRIEFLHLKRLDLGGNKIESVEGLYWASTPKLK